MGLVILVTGGARAGKSRFALARALERPAPRRFVATADPAASAADPEMAARLAAHRRERGQAFETVEAPAAPAAALREAARARAAAVVLDDLTLWVAGRLERLTGSGGPGGTWSPAAGWAEALDAEACDLVAALREAADAGATVVVVTNEVGWGIVPADPLARAYRDTLGRVNATVAASADQVWLVVAGLPLRVK